MPAVKEAVVANRDCDCLTTRLGKVPYLYKCAVVKVVSALWGRLSDNRAFAAFCRYNPCCSASTF